MIPSSACPPRHPDQQGPRRTARRPPAPPTPLGGTRSPSGATDRVRSLALNTYVPVDLVEAIDKIKEQRGVSGRAPIIEEALRFYIEKQQGA
ncbi:ribbon-helix-helix domain-containing protein [Ancylobacter sp. VNQ12]|uniref:ribbon-helix-helix domain-containing protein n=1 Tax=Ancylobacter sp. VNQ12 TaxID=3400920 RepID=UPI003C00AD8C